MRADLNLYWGDLHNPNELGYAQGRLKRGYEIAAKILRRLARNLDSRRCLRSCQHQSVSAR